MFYSVRNTLRIPIWFIFLSTLIACGGGGGGGNSSQSTPSPTVLTGVFMDSVVAGLDYLTETQSGSTNTAGEFQYLANQSITFSIGDIILGTTTAGPIITPLSLVEGAVDASDPRVLNIVRLLLTLDVDGDPSNGIEISSTVRDAATGLSIDFASSTFEQDIQPFLDTAIGAGSQLVALNDAQNHFDTNLKTSWGTMTWGTDCWNQLCQ